MRRLSPSSRWARSQSQQRQAATLAPFAGHLLPAICGAMSPAKRVPPPNSLTPPPRKLSGSKTKHDTDTTPSAKQKKTAAFNARSPDTSAMGVLARIRASAGPLSGLGQWCDLRPDEASLDPERAVHRYRLDPLAPRHHHDHPSAL